MYQVKVGSTGTIVLHPFWSVRSRVIIYILNWLSQASFLESCYLYCYYDSSLLHLDTWWVYRRISPNKERIWCGKSTFIVKCSQKNNFKNRIKNNFFLGFELMSFDLMNNTYTYELEGNMIQEKYQPNHYHQLICGSI